MALCAGCLEKLELYDVKKFVVNEIMEEVFKGNDHLLGAERLKPKTELPKLN